MGSAYRKRVGFVDIIKLSGQLAKKFANNKIICDNFIRLCPLAR
jgi:hypothetical protein